MLSFGGPATFTPSAWEWHFRATAIRQDDPERARQIIDDGLEVHPESPGLRYYLGCLEAEQGNRDAAIECLRYAVEHAPGVVEEARKEKAFESLADDPEFRELTGS